MNGLIDRLSYANVVASLALFIALGGGAYAVTDGPAGGDLTGTYPNPTIAPLAVTTGKLANGAVTPEKLAADVARYDLPGTFRSLQTFAGGARVQGESSKLELLSGRPLQNLQNPNYVNPTGTKVFEVDDVGNLLAGPNELLRTREGSRVGVPDFFYSARSRRLYTRSLFLADVGDPPDLYLQRTGPDNDYPAPNPTGVLNGQSLGGLKWRGWTTPANGTPGVTPNGDFQETSAQIYTRAAEDLRARSVGGRLILATTAKGGDTPTDRMTITENGNVMIGTADENDPGQNVPLFQDEARLQVVSTNPNREGFLIRAAANQNEAPFAIRAADGSRIFTVRPTGRLELNGEISMLRPPGGVVFRASAPGEPENRVQITNDGAIRFGPGNAPADATFRRYAPNVIGSDDNWRIGTAGRGLQVREGANAKMGTARLVAGTAVVSTTAAKPESRIFLTPQDGSTFTAGSVWVSARTANSFTISSTNPGDNRNVAYFIVDPV